MVVLNVWRFIIFGYIFCMLVDKYFFFGIGLAL